MISIRQANERGHARHSWLDARHTFSFANYYDPDFMGFRSLRVINEDRIAPGGGFAQHGHRDMEIITYVLEGALKHEDSIGNQGIIRPGEVQYMSAGSGILHSEYNASKTDPAHLLQIWIVPDLDGLNPHYEQRKLSPQPNQNSLQPIAAKDGKDGAIAIHQDANLLAGTLTPGQPYFYSLNPQRYAWIQVARGSINLNGITLEAGDGAVVTVETELKFEAITAAEILLFDLA